MLSDRRGDMKMIAVAAVVVGCGVAVPAAARTLDLSKPEDALQVMRKITCGTTEDGTTRFGTWWGRAYGRVSWEKDRHLFNIVGVNVPSVQHRQGRQPWRRIPLGQPRSHVLPGPRHQCRTRYMAEPLYRRDGESGSRRQRSGQYARADIPARQGRDAGAGQSGAVRRLAGQSIRSAALL